MADDLDVFGDDPMDDDARKEMLAELSEKEAQLLHELAEISKQRRALEVQ